MGFIKRLLGKEARASAGAGGLLLFTNTSEVLRAERVLKEAGFKVQVMGPPPELRRGCDLIIEFPLVMQPAVERVLAHHRMPPLEVVPVSGPLLKPLELCKVKDFGRHLMVTAANMKITVDKETLTIVNVSGGGCPDVPYLARLLVGQSLTAAADPRERGHTLCGYSLGIAFREVRRLLGVAG